MSLKYVKHEKVSLRKQPEFNEVWLHDRICDDPAILGFGDVRVLDRERVTQGGGRLDMLLFDEENNRRYEVEIQLGNTDPSHIIRCIEYWDAERRRYPGYEHVAVLVAEDVTTRFLNLMGLLSGTIPMVAVQLDALQLDEQLLLNFTHVLDQTQLRTDDTEEDGGGGEVDRAYWEQKATPQLVQVCDALLKIVNRVSSQTHQLNYLRNYIGLQSAGRSNNFIFFQARRTKGFVIVRFRNTNAADWYERFDEAGLRVRQKKLHRFELTITPAELQDHAALIEEAITETVKEFEG